MVITYEIEKTISCKTVSLKTLTETTHTDVIKYIDTERSNVLNDFLDMTKAYSGWKVDEYDTSISCPSFVAHKETKMQTTKVELYMRSAMYYENDYEGIM